MKKDYDSLSKKAVELYKSGMEPDEIIRTLGYENKFKFYNSVFPNTDTPWEDERRKLRDRVIYLYIQEKRSLTSIAKAEFGKPDWERVVKRLGPYRGEVENAIKEEDDKRATEIYNQIMEYYNSGMTISTAFMCVGLKIGNKRNTKLYKKFKELGLKLPKADRSHEKFRHRKCFKRDFSKDAIQKYIELHKKGIPDWEIFHYSKTLWYRTGKDISIVATHQIGYNPFWFGVNPTYVEPYDFSKVTLNSKEDMISLFNDLNKYCSDRFGVYTTYEALKEIVEKDSRDIKKIVSNAVFAEETKRVKLYGKPEKPQEE